MSGGHGGGGKNPVMKYVHFWIEHLTDLGAFVHYFSDFGISRALILSILFWGELWILTLQIPNLPAFAFAWLFGTMPIWLPVALYIGAIHIWIWYIQSLYISTRKPILLEVKMPREITRSPRAMELAFTAFSVSSGESTFLQRGWDGRVRPYFSFEIASFGGEVHFFVWCWQDYKGVVEAALYGGYPEVEIYEVEDYASRWRFDPHKHKAWGVEWPRMTYLNVDMGDPRINAYPIRTYVDFELDKDPKEEHMVDPLGTVLEFMSSIKPNEQLWVQMVIRKCGGYNVFLRGDLDREWKKTVEKEVQRLRAHAAIVPGSILKEAFEEQGEHLETTRQSTNARPSWKHQKMMESMERNLGKYPMEVGLRGIYWVEGNLRGPITTGFRWMWRPFGNPMYGTHLRPRRWHCDFDYPWQDFRGMRWTNQAYRVLDAYRRRMFFHSPWVIPFNIITNEELATIWHPPSRAVAAPGLQRISATKSEPPPNLPK